MRKKTGPNFIEPAISEIPDFDHRFKLLERQIQLNGQSQSTFYNYIRRIAIISIEFGKLPENVPDYKIMDFLSKLASQANSPSLSIFKHTVYGLRYYYKTIGQNDRAIALPSLKKEKRLPVILNRTELKELFRTPTLLKHRIALTLIYSAGLRKMEAINLKLSDIDFERKTIHIRQSKYRKDRIVPLSDIMAKGLLKYIDLEKPNVWLFNGRGANGQYSASGLSWIIRQTLKKTSIQKQVNLHSLRHSYATHLIEDGLNIVTVKDLLGHANINTTMVYLQVAQSNWVRPFSPLDNLYRNQNAVEY